jgi:CheY-like chemotaxis protein
VLDLPETETTASAGSLTSQHETLAHPPVAPLQDVSILLVEDNPTTQQLLTLILGKTGCHLEITSNGSHALANLENSSYDLIFMDCEMPDMDGFEATRALRERNYTTPVIALTAHVGKDDMVRCLEAGMNDCLSKPFRQKQLLDMINKWLPGDSGAVNEG